MFIGGFHIGARALDVLNLIWFGCIARPIPVRSMMLSSSFIWFLPAFATRRGGGGGSAPCMDYHCWEKSIEGSQCRREKHCGAGRYSHQTGDPGRDPYLQQEEFRLETSNMIRIFLLNPDHFVQHRFDSAKFWGGSTFLIWPVHRLLWFWSNG